MTETFMAKKYTPKELENITQFIAQQQKLLGGAMVMQMVHFGANNSVVHTEILNPDVSHRKYLVSTTVQPLTEELKENIMKQNGRQK